MSKSISKIRHIQEMNEKLEEKFLEEQLLNSLKAGVKGAAANVGTRTKNALSSKQKIRKSPKLESLNVKIKTRSEYLNKQLEYLKKELSDYNNELNEMKKTSPDYTKEIDQVIAQVNSYYSGIDNLVGQGNNLQGLNIQYFG